MRETSPVPERRRRWPVIRNVLTILFLVLVGIQFIQPSKDNQYADMRFDVGKVVHVPDSVERLLRRSCYDCHSNYTDYPWYSNIQPGGWLMDHDIKEGKSHLNFQEFALLEPRGNFATKQAYQRHLLEEVSEIVRSGEMPLKPYLWLHEEARLTEAERKTISDWARNAITEITDSEETPDDSP